MSATLSPVGVTLAAAADEDAIATRHMVVDPASGLAIGGYDPVAYFVDKRPRRGSARFELTWSGVIWRFVNTGNLQAFERDPLVYAPSYGGYDARAFAQGIEADGDPRIWAIRKNRLFLFHSPARRFSWLTSPDQFTSLADKAWKRLTN